MTCLEKDQQSMLAFYDFPAENWQYIRTTTAKKHHMQYQKMIRQLLDEYVTHQKEMQSNKS